jgi:hypothetical protein
MKRKSTLRMLAVALCISAASFSVSAQYVSGTGTTSDPFIYTSDNDNLMFSVISGTNVRVGNNSTTESNGLSAKGNDSKLVIPEQITVSGTTYNVTEIGQYAFRNCTAFTGNLTVPNTVTAIENSAFNGCSKLSGT